MIYISFYLLVAFVVLMFSAGFYFIRFDDTEDDEAKAEQETGGHWFKICGMALGTSIMWPILLIILIIRGIADVQKLIYK